jgi:hypothetical protein
MPPQFPRLAHREWPPGVVPAALPLILALSTLSGALAFAALGLALSLP